MTKQITFHLETITPMFLAGEDQAVFEFRPPSFKGLLRFWWRAYFWGKQPSNISPKELEKAEGKIFGTTSNNGRKSRVSLRIKAPRTEGTRKPFPKHLLKNGSGGFSSNILEYLAYGTYGGRGNQFIRDYLPPNITFELILSLPDTEDFKEQERQIVMSVYLLATCGGIGSKARNGFGNIRIRSITETRNHGKEEREYAREFSLGFPSHEFFQEHVKNGTSPDEVPEFTALSRQMRIFRLKQDTYRNWDDCLAALGEIYRAAKSRLDKPLKCEKRQYIAAPITIQKRVGGRWKTYDSSFLERRAKPYFLRVVQNGEHDYQGYILYLPSHYCPKIEHNGKANPLGMRIQTTDYLRPTNMGFGVSHTLPIIVAGLMAEPGSMLIVENPESHLHPAAQSKIAQFLARIAACGVQVVIETHSDHVLNGIRLATYYGKISPDDIILHSFESTVEDGAMQIKVTCPQIDRDGRIDYWPNGFFDEWEKSLGTLLMPRGEED